jgi:hypothetical protein
MNKEPLTRVKKEHWRPHGYQLKATRFVLERDHGGLLLDPG